MLTASWVIRLVFALQPIIDASAAYAHHTSNGTLADINIMNAAKFVPYGTGHPLPSQYITARVIRAPELCAFWASRQAFEQD